jgi:chromate transporter
MSDDDAPRVTLWQALPFWLKLGCIGFGGPAGQIAIMHEELVEKRQWISERRFLHALNYCMLLPGPEAQQLATYLGWLLHRTPGGLAAGALFVLPSLVLMIALSWAYVVWGTTPLLAGLFYGIKPAVTAIVVHAAWRIGRRALGNAVLWGIAAAAFLAVGVFGVAFPWVVLAAATTGAVGGRLAAPLFAAGSHGAPGRGASREGGGRALVDDDTPPPAHARFSGRRAVGHLMVGLAVWAAGIAVVRSVGGPGGTLAEMAAFFTKAALVTFGGAYAVLPYVYQASVGHYGWLSGPQMIDGLALGETTPGPLIMVVAFVGFLGGWHAGAGLPGGPAMAGIAGACVATAFTFLPSFVFILVGGPLVESTRDRHAFTAPLTAITAAVVGVIASLAVFFAAHVLWPAGPVSLAGFDPVAAVVGVLAALALFRWSRSVVEVVAGCAVAGLLLSLGGVGR